MWYTVHCSTVLYDLDHHIDNIDILFSFLNMIRSVQIGRHICNHFICIDQDDRMFPRYILSLDAFRNLVFHFCSMHILHPDPMPNQHRHPLALYSLCPPYCGIDADSNVLIDVGILLNSVLNLSMQ